MVWNGKMTVVLWQNSQMKPFPWHSCKRRHLGSQGGTASCAGETELGFIQNRGSICFSMSMMIAFRRMDQNNNNNNRNHTTKWRLQGRMGFYRAWPFKPRSYRIPSWVPVGCLWLANQGLWTNVLHAQGWMWWRVKWKETPSSLDPDTRKGAYPRWTHTSQLSTWAREALRMSLSKGANSPFLVLRKSSMENMWHSSVKWLGTCSNSFSTLPRGDSP